MESAPPVVLQCLKEEHDTSAFVRMGIASIHIYALPLRKGENLVGSLAIVHDSGYIKGESLRIWRETFLSALAHVVIIVLITLLIVRWSIAGPIARTAYWMKALRTGRSMARIRVPDLDLFRPLAREVATFAESLKPLVPLRNSKLAYANPENPFGRQTAWRFTSVRVSKTAGCSSCPIASLTFTFARENPSRSNSLPAVWSPPLNPCSAPAAEPGLPTAPATLISKLWMSTTACRFLPTILITRCAGFGFQRGRAGLLLRLRQ